MSDSASRREVGRLDAARRRHSSKAAGRSLGRIVHRLGKYRLSAVALAVPVLAAPALAGVPGIWRGSFDGPHRKPTFTNAQPDTQLLALLGALRRPAEPSDRSPAALSAIERSGPLDGVSANSVRYVGISPLGDPLFLVPYRSRIRLIPPRETNTAAPAPRRMLGNRPDTSTPRSVSAAGPQAHSSNLQRFLNRPGVCLIGVGDGTPEIEDCVASADIAAGTDYATVGVYRTSPEATSPPPSATTPPHVVATVASGIVPDGVAIVQLSFDSGKKLIVPVTNNYFTFILRRGQQHVSAITWFGPDERVIRHILIG